MSTSKPHLVTPPIPKTFELDAHSRHFFDPTDHSAPVEAHFRLDHPPVQRHGFHGCVARSCTGALHLVIKEFSGEATVDAKAPVLMSALAMPFHSTDPEERDHATRDYFLQYPNYPEPTGARDWRESVPTLRGATSRAGYTRLHFDTATGLGLQFHEDGCNVFDLREPEHIFNEVWPHIDLGDALFDYEWTEDPMHAFVQISDESFHKRVAESLSNEQSAVAHSVAFRLLDMGERCHHVFGCEEAELQRTREMLRLALTVEMSAGGALCGWTQVSWQPFGEEEFIEGRGANFEKVMEDVPSSLAKWLSLICGVTGCHLNEDIRDDEEGTHSFARSFANAFVVAVDKPSAHELLEARIRLKEMLGDGKSKCASA